MKKMIFVSLCLSLLWGCSKAGTIQFCEGVTPKGEGVRCGKKFESGDITAIITSKEPFGTRQITVQIAQKREKKSEIVETVTVNVLPDKQTATANLSFYTAGIFSVTAKGKTGLGSGEVEIVDF